jgi:glycosyltransferase involved in cell wall biosynthesis
MRVSITIPVYNEEGCLANTLKRLHDFLSSHEFGWDWESSSPTRINRSHEGSRWEVFIRSEFRDAQSAIRICRQRRALGDAGAEGRGWALKHVWLNTDADVLVYMDADLSTELDALPALIGESN